MRIPWNEEEIKLLKQLYDDPNLTITEVSRVFKNRSRGSIEAKAKYLGLLKATPKAEIDYEYLRKLGVVVEG